MDGKLVSFKAKGFGVAAVTYDSPGVLKHFAERKGLTLPLLSDHESATIRAFGILNDNVEPGSEFHGVPFPGTYVVDPNGIVRSKYFEEDYRERHSAGSILRKETGTSESPASEIATAHLTLRTSATNLEVYAGSRVTLSLEVTVKPGMHVYAPGAGDYIPIDWALPESKHWVAFPAAVPRSRTLYIKAIREKVPVYEKTFGLTRDITFGLARELAPVTSADGRIVVESTFRYQACDDRTCFLPVTVPLRWEFRLIPSDSQRAPKEFRRIDD